MLTTLVLRSCTILQNSVVLTELNLKLPLSFQVRNCKIIPQARIYSNLYNRTKQFASRSNFLHDKFCYEKMNLYFAKLPLTCPKVHNFGKTFYTVQVSFSQFYYHFQLIEHIIQTQYEIRQNLDEQIVYQIKLASKIISSILSNGHFRILITPSYTYDPMVLRYNSPEQITFITC